MDRPTIYIERERQIRTFHGDGDPSKAVEFEEEVRRAWSSLPTEDKDKRLDVILRNVGPAVKAEISCQSNAVQKDPEALLDAIASIFGEKRSPSQPQGGDAQRLLNYSLLPLSRQDVSLSVMCLLLTFCPVETPLPGGELRKWGLWEDF